MKILMESYRNKYLKNIELQGFHIKKLNSGRSRTKDLSVEEKYIRLKVKLKLLKAESELDTIEMQAPKKK
ncbi:hypothetical protein AVM15_03245 [Paraclostridium benzoelyticum]|nr:hypothetical protein AVM15_03245 [Paraclostridium benzoelyticum]